MGTLPSLIPLRGCNGIVTGAVGGVGSVLMSALEELGLPGVVGIDLPAAVASGADPDRLIGADLAECGLGIRRRPRSRRRLGGWTASWARLAERCNPAPGRPVPGQAFRDGVAANLHSQFWTAQLPTRRW